MPQYLVANYLPDDFDPSTVTEAMIEEIHALNREMIAAGVRKFACGISPAANAKTVRKQSDGTVLVTDGPYLETKEHVGGFWILEAADMDEALAWARKGAIACDTVARCANFYSSRTRTEQRNSLAAATLNSQGFTKLYSWSHLEARSQNDQEDSNMNDSFFRFDAYDNAPSAVYRRSKSRLRVMHRSTDLRCITKFTARAIPWSCCTGRS